MNRLGKSALVAAALLVPIAGVSARPNNVLIDIRVHGTGAKEIFLTNPGDTFTLDVFATVTGSDNDLTNDGLGGFAGSFLTSNGGLLGNLSPLNVQPGFDALSSSPGIASDLDGDGDLDIGTNATSGSGNGMFGVRAPSFPAVNHTLIGQFSFTALSLSAPSTDIRFRGVTLRSFGTAKFDGVGVLLGSAEGPFVTYGAPVTVRADVTNNGPTTFLSGNVNTHVTVDGTVLPAAGSTVVLTNGLTVHAGGLFDMRDLTDGTTENHEVRINDNASGNEGGSLFVNSMTVGYSSNGSFVQSGGVSSINQIVAGRASGANGTIRVTGGSLFGTTLTVASGGGSGTLEQTAGQTAVSTLNARPASGASALVSVSGGQLTATGANIDDSNGGVARYVQTGGVANVNGTLTISGTATGDVRATLDGGMLSPNRLNVKGHSALVQNGGVLNAGAMLVTGSGVAGDGYVLNGGQAVIGSMSINQPNNASPVAVVQNGGTMSITSSAFTEHSRGALTVNNGVLNIERLAPTFGGSLRLNAGTARVNAVMFSFAGNQPSDRGRLDLYGGTFRIGKEVSGAGTIDFANSAAHLTAGDGSFADFSKVGFENSSNAIVYGEVNSLMQFAAGFDPLSAFGSFTSDGIVHVAGEPLLIPPSARVGGNGAIIGNTTNNGTVSPGNSPGQISVDGNYAQGANAHLEIQIGGTASDEFDLLAVLGNATLNGTLDVSLINDFTPSSGNSFTFLTASNGISGRFANTLGDQVFFNGGRFDVAYGLNSITLSNFVAVPEPTTMGVIALAGFGAFARRRRRDAR